MLAQGAAELNLRAQHRVPTQRRPWVSRGLTLTGAPSGVSGQDLEEEKEDELPARLAGDRGPPPHGSTPLRSHEAVGGAGGSDSLPCAQYTRPASAERAGRPPVALW